MIHFSLELLYVLQDFYTFRFVLFLLELLSSLLRLINLLLHYFQLIKVLKRLKVKRVLFVRLNLLECFLMNSLKHQNFTGCIFDEVGGCVIQIILLLLSIGRLLTT